MTTVKVDKEVLAATVIALDAFAADLPGLFSRAAGLGARTEMAGLNGSGQWATDTARDLRGRIGVLEAMNQANPTFGGVRMDGADALAIAGQTMTVEDALVTLRTAGAPANAWEDTDPANLQEWFHELQAEALDRLADLNDEGQAEALVAAYHDLQNLVVGSSAAVSTMTYLVTQGGPALAQWLAQRQIVQPALARAAASSPGVANWLSGAR